MTIPVLLIDGNNLAHFLYTNWEPGHKMTPADSQRLIGHFSSYARNYADIVEVELCLDRSPGILPLTPDGLRVFAADPPQTGDDLLLYRLEYHLFEARPCLVITNDEDVMEEVLRQGGAVLKVSDFVRRTGAAKPVFRDPADLPRFASTRKDGAQAKPETNITDGTIARISTEGGNGKGKKGKRAASRVHPSQMPGMQPIPQPGERQQPSHVKEVASSPVDQAPVQTEPTPTTAVDPGPFYRLTIENWPPREGARFLLNAFCPAHEAEYHELMKTFDREALRPDDLRALADLLVDACGAEPDFGRKGALMNRVRLTLLKVGGGPLSLHELAERTGLPEKGLRGRIREKADQWLAITQ